MILFKNSGIIVCMLNVEINGYRVEELGAKRPNGMVVGPFGVIEVSGPDAEAAKRGLEAYRRAVREDRVYRDYTPLKVKHITGK